MYMYTVLYVCVVCVCGGGGGGGGGEWVGSLIPDKFFPGQRRLAMQG